MKQTAVVILLLAGLMLGCSKPQEQQPQKQIHPDVEVLENMRQHGSDMSRPHPIDYYLYFPVEEQARAAASSLQGVGYDILRVEVGAGADGKWLVLAQKTLVPSAEDVIASTDQMEALAARHGGEFDGWEAPILR